MDKYVRILGIPFVTKRFNEVVSILSEKISNEEKTFVVTANPEIVMYGEEHDDYKRIIQSANYVVPDGVGILIASKILGNPINERVAGFDLTMKLIELANSNQWKVYFLGGTKEVNEKAVVQVRKDYPNLQLVGHHHGYFDWDDEALPEEIAQLGPDIVFVCLGMPRQEQWIHKHFHRFNKGVFIGVGGSIDVLAGEAKRAPDIWIKLNLEWFYRLLKQPSRWRRQLALPKFVLKVLKERFGTGGRA